MITNIRENMYSYYSHWDGAYTEKTFDLTSGGKNIGTLTTGYVGPYYFNDQEIHFLETTNKVLLNIGLLSLVLATIVGLFMARSITIPLKRVITFLDAVSHNKSADGDLRVGHSLELQKLYGSALSLEMRIHRQEKLRQQLTQDMAHELKTPLSAIQGQLEAMIDGIFELSINRLSGCHEEILRIKELIEEIEALSFIENNNLSLDLGHFDFSSMVEELNQLFSAEMVQQGMHLNYIDRSPDHLLFGDEGKIRQVLCNLLKNSIKYAGKHAMITMTFGRTSEGYYHITFKDSGPGIEEKDLPYIFERFYRGDSSRTGHNGLGIGLTLVRAIIEQHNGTVTAARNSAGETVFDMTL